MPKNVKGGPLGVFELSLFCKTEKNEGDPLETLKKFAKKMSHNDEKNLQKNFFGHGGTRTHVFLLGKPQKNIIKLYAKC